MMNVLSRSRSTAAALGGCLTNGINDLLHRYVCQNQFSTHEAILLDLVSQRFARLYCEQ